MLFSNGKENKKLFLHNEYYKILNLEKQQISN